MRRLIILCALTLYVFLSIGARAQALNPSEVDIPIISVNGDGGPTPGQPSLLNLEADALTGAISALRVEHPYGEVLRFTPQELMEPAAVMTISRALISKDVVLIQLLGEFSPATGGVVRVIFLREYGILSADDYRILDLRLVRTLAGSWVLTRGRDIAADGAYPVTGLFLASRRSGNKEVGIERVDTYSGSEQVESYDTENLPEADFLRNADSVLYDLPSFLHGHGVGTFENHSISRAHDVL